MFDFTGIRPARFVSLEKGRAPTLSDTSTSSSQFRLTAGTLSPGEEGGPSFRTWILSDSCMIVSCLAARSAFPYETEKAAALPVVKHIETSSKDLYLLGGHRYWCSETSGRSRKYEHKKCPELLLGRLSPPLERTALYMFDGGKGTKKSRTSKEIREKFS